MKKYAIAAIMMSLLCAASPAGERGDVVGTTQESDNAFIPALAVHFEINEIELNNLSRRGYGRNELIKLILISKKAKKELKEIVIQRDRDTRLSVLCERYGINYDEILTETTSQRKIIHDQLSRAHP